MRIMTRVGCNGGKAYSFSINTHHAHIYVHLYPGQRRTGFKRVMTTVRYDGRTGAKGEGILSAHGPERTVVSTEQAFRWITTGVG